MNPTRLVQIGIVGSACAVMLFAADFWKTKDSTLWTDDEVSKMLSDSPWAKAKTVQPQQSQAGGLRHGPPEAGSDFPAAVDTRAVEAVTRWRRRRWLSGGWYRTVVAAILEHRKYGDPSQNEPMNLTIRWDSALPMQQAHSCARAPQLSDELKAVAAARRKSITSFPCLACACRARAEAAPSTLTTDATTTANNNDDSQRGRNQRNDAAAFATAGLPRNSRPRARAPSTRRTFRSRDPAESTACASCSRAPIPSAAGDKEVDFILDIRRIKVEEKFKLSDMQYEGKLAL